MMITQRHKHIDGSVSYVKYKNGGYNMTIEVVTKKYDREEKKYIENTVYLANERAMRIEQANAWMQERRKIW